MSAREFAVIDPATGTAIGHVPDASPADATEAVARAHQALAQWSMTSPRHRSDVLARAHGLLLRDRETLAATIVSENGKSRTDADNEVTYAAEFLRWYAEEAVRHEGEFHSSPYGGSRTIVTARPVGVAVLVTPWNFPAAMLTRKIAPALAAGCTVVVKPSEDTPLTALAVAALMDEAGAGDGVVNVVTTRRSPEVVAAMLADKRVRKLSFTGSTAVGSVLLAQTAPRVLNTSLELGGSAPFVVRDDADLDAAVECALAAKFRGGGQACTAANTFFVHAAVADEFSARFGHAIERLVVGPGLDPQVDVGPVVSATAARRLRDLVDVSVAEGARVLASAPVPEDSPGFFVAPTLLVDVAPDAEIVHQEIFGPVAPVVTWTDEDDLLQMLNRSDYGLAAYVCSSDLQWAIRLAEALEIGMVGINRGAISDPATPFGGTKLSGLGREGARAGIREYQETQYFSIDWSA